MASKTGLDMARVDIINVCCEKIEGFRDRKFPAQNSWVTRFTKRHALQEYVARYVQVKKVKTLPLDNKPIPPPDPVM